MKIVVPYLDCDFKISSIKKPEAIMMKKHPIDKAIFLSSDSSKTFKTIEAKNKQYKNKLKEAIKKHPILIKTQQFLSFAISLKLTNQFNHFNSQ